jgi:hypothetical protein
MSEIPVGVAISAEGMWRFSSANSWSITSLSVDRSQTAEYIITNLYVFIILCFAFTASQVIGCDTTRITRLECIDCASRDAAFSRFSYECVPVHVPLKLINAVTD